MHRRDLLLFRIRPDTTVCVLACERLYMRYLDTRRPAAPAAALDDHWLGEPEPQVPAPTARDLFDGLRRDLAGTDVLHVVGPQWLADPELKREVDGLVAALRASGSRVEFADAAPPDVGSA